MDISKILDFHRLVMMSAGQHKCEDETSCGPLCQHPACWDSNRRRERGVPRILPDDASQQDDNFDLPTQKFYNMLEDFGESPKDRYPARYGGRSLHERSSSTKSEESFTTVPFASPVSPDKGYGPPALRTSLHTVEVQEVFDRNDLNSRWDETFMTRQMLVWVPNPFKKVKDVKPPLDITEKEFGKDSKILQPQDLTETMIPRQIQCQREESVLFDEWPVLKKKSRNSRSHVFRQGAYPKTPFAPAKPNIDPEGVRELLALPKQMLLQVLDRTKESDFRSRDKLHGIIEDVLSTARNGHCAGSAVADLPHRSITGQMYTSDVLVQQKLPLHYNKRRTIRGTCTMEQKPVFQLDNEDKNSSVDTTRDMVNASSIHEAGLAYRYTGPLPAVPHGIEVTPRSAVMKWERQHGRKLPSVSLGLPELPSGLRNTRAFVYNTKHKPDFTLVPVPTPPTSERSLESAASDQGTTLRVNLPSVTDLLDADYHQPYSHAPRSLTDREALHGVSPTLSTRVPKASAGTPATFHSKLVHDFTTATTDSRRSLSPEKRLWTHDLLTSGTAATEDKVLGTIQETSPGQGSHGNSHNGERNFEPPPQPPTSPLSLPQVGSPEPWPQVTEPDYQDSAPIKVAATFHTDSSLQRGRSDLSSCESDRSAQLARKMLDEGGKGESPAPPPPSPEPGDKPGTRGSLKRSTLSRESTSMAPLVEQNESESRLCSPDKKTWSDSVKGCAVAPVIQEESTPSPKDTPLEPPDQVFDPVSKVMISHIAPRPSANGEKLQETFMNVDIPAGDMSNKNAEGGSSATYAPSSSIFPVKSPPKGPAPDSQPVDHHQPSSTQVSSEVKNTLTNNPGPRATSAEHKDRPKVNPTSSTPV